MKQHEKRNETKIDEKALEEKIIQQQIEYSQQQAVGEFYPILMMEVILIRRFTV